MLNSRLLRETAGYLVASAAAFGLDIGLLALQVSMLGMHYLAAAGVSFIAGTLFVYWASVRRIFGFRRVHDRSLEFSLFLGIGVVGLLVNLAVIFLVVHQLQLHYLVGKCAAASATFGTNFALRRAMLFSPWRKDVGLRSVESDSAR